jgi:serine/threonine protein kinase
MTRPASQLIADGVAYLSKTDVLKIRSSAEFRNKYQVLKRLGHGAFAEVYLMEDRSTRDKFAAKMIDRTAVQHPKQVWNELHILSTITRPLVIRLFGAYASERHLVLVLEYAKGGELYERIEADDDFGERQSIYITQRLLEAVAYLHDHRVAHWDIKPENVLFLDTNFDHLKLSDFGLSGVLKPDSLLVTCAGTPCFMAPEVLRSTAGYGVECDLWSIGVLTFFLLSGKLPFDDPAHFLQYQNILKGTYSFGPDFDDIFDHAKDFVRHLLVVDPKMRMTARQALGHPWLAFAERIGTSSSRGAVLLALGKRKALKEYRPQTIAVSFISRLKFKAKSAKEENRQDG